MILWLIKQINKILKAINSEQSPKEIALGFSIGIILGVVPFNIVTSTGWLIILVSLKTNISIAVLGIAIGKLLTLFIHPLAHILGLRLLTQPSIESLWTTLYNSPIVLTQFNNTITLGSTVIGILTIPLTYIGAKKGIIIYREKYRDKLNNTKLMKLIKASKWVSLSQKVAK